MRTVIVAGNPVLREGLNRILAGSGLQVVGIYAPVAGAVEEIRAAAPDLAFLALRAAPRDDLDALESIAQASPRTAIVVISLSDDPSCLLEAVHRGASCYLSGEVSAQGLALAANAALQGYVLADRALLSRACAASALRCAAGHHPPAALTPREREVLQLLCRGLCNREIAQQLTVTVGTVRTHVSTILGKLGVTGRVQAAVWAAEHGLSHAGEGEKVTIPAP